MNDSNVFRLVMNDGSILYRIKSLKAISALTSTLINEKVVKTSAPDTNFPPILTSNKKEKDYYNREIKNITMIPKVKINQIDKMISKLNRIRNTYHIKPLGDDNPINYSKFIELDNHEFNKYLVQILTISKVIDEHQTELLNISKTFQEKFN